MTLCVCHMLEAGRRRRLLLWVYNCVCVRVQTTVNSESATKKVVQWRPILCYSSVIFALDWRWAAGQQKITKIPRLEPIMNSAGRKPSLIYHVLRRNLVFTKRWKQGRQSYCYKGTSGWECTRITTRSRQKKYLELCNQSFLFYGGT